MTKVAIVILNWNGAHFLSRFLPSVMNTRFDDFEVIVADNGSTDDSIKLLSEKFTRVRLIRFDKNHGFAQGYNEALRQVEAKYYVLLNSDVEVMPGWLEPMYSLLESDQSIAACQPKLLTHANPHLFEYAGGAGGWLDEFGYPFARGRIFDVCEDDRGQYDQTCPIFWASGAAMFIRSSAFHEVGGFDGYFFAHQEEIDLCWRLQLAGHKIYSCPSSVVHHVGGGTLPRGNSMKTLLNFRNNQIMLFKNLPWSELWWKIPFRQLLDALSAWKGLLTGDAGYFIAIIRGHIGFVRWLLFNRRKSVFPETKRGQFSGYYKGNVAWEHFMKKKKFFSEIVLQG